MPDMNKAALIATHRRNALLQAPFLSPAPRHDRDLAAEGPSGVLSASVLDATVAALVSGQTHYVDVPGIGPLREAFAKHVAALGARGYAAATTAVTASVQEARFLATQAIGEAIAEVALPAVVHPGAAKAVGLRPKRVHRLPVDPARGFVPTVAGIEAALAAGARLLYLESPVRLSGAVITADDLSAVARLLERHDAHAIVDQGAAPFVPGGFASLGAVDGMSARATLIGEGFPGVGLEGWSIGYLATSVTWFAGVTKIKQIMSICTATPSQYAALSVGERFDAERGERAARLAVVREAGARAARAAGHAVIPGTAAHVLAIRPRDPAAARRALAAAGIDAADGAAFGAPDTLRLAVAGDTTLDAALAAIR